MFRHILLPTDGSELSRETARRAVSFAEAAGAQITAIYVKQAMPMDFEGDLIDPSALDRISHAVEKKAKEFLGFVKKLCKESGVTCKTIAASGSHPYEEIVRVATEEGCDLVFMASHGRRGLQSLLLGSETQRVLSYSSIPVLVYRPPHPDKHHRKAKTKD
jgi:nucleotide-binding universal stress UspA family protein